MKNIKLPMIAALLILFLSACSETGYIKVKNNVHNVQIYDIRWGDHSGYYSLMSGETSDEISITDWQDAWPKSNSLKFTMEGNGKSIYLETKAKYTLNYDETITIEINDTTEVINKLLE